MAGDEPVAREEQLADKRERLEPTSSGRQALLVCPPAKPSIQRTPPSELLERARGLLPSLQAANQQLAYDLASQPPGRLDIEQLGPDNKPHIAMNIACGLFEGDGGQGDVGKAQTADGGAQAQKQLGLSLLSQPGLRLLGFAGSSTGTSSSSQSESDSSEVSSVDQGADDSEVPETLVHGPLQGHRRKLCQRGKSERAGLDRQGDKKRPCIQML